MRSAITIIIPLLLLSCQSEDARMSETSSNPTLSTTAMEESSSSSGPSESTSMESGTPGTSTTSSDTQSETSSGETSSTSTCERNAEMFDGCRHDCECLDAAGIDRSCRYNYAGGYLAECTNTCNDDLQCESGTCSGGWCVQAFCDASTPCAVGVCYPTTLLDGTQLTDPDHPQPHCMSEAQ